MRRVPRRALAPLALMLLTAGCTTFSDNDAVARVGNVELSRAELDDQLAELGLEATDEAVPAAFARPSISSWIQEQAVEQDLFSAGALAAVPPETIAAGYDRGLDAAGITCPAILVTDSFAIAEEAVARLDDGEEFEAVFTDVNIDPNLDATTGRFACVQRSDLGDDVLDTPDVRALRSVSADTPQAAAAIVDPVGAEFGVVVAFRGYDSLDDEERAQVDAVIAPLIVVEDIDIHVDPRYGRFDPASGTVVDLD